VRLGNCRAGLIVVSRQSSHPLGELLDRLWSVQVQTTEGQETLASIIDLDAALGIMKEIAVNRGYTREMKHPTFKRVGRLSLSLFADYLNHTLELQGDERLPVLEDR
jgi:hypothetical protein